MSAQPVETGTDWLKGYLNVEELLHQASELLEVCRPGRALPNLGDHSGGEGFPSLIRQGIFDMGGKLTHWVSGAGHLSGIHEELDPRKGLRERRSILTA